MGDLYHSARWRTRRPVQRSHDRWYCKRDRSTISGVRSLILGGLLLALVAATAAIAVPAHAGQQCWQQIIEEWSASGGVSTTYSIQCYGQAAANAPDDLLLYSSFEGDVSAAKRGAIRSQSSGPAPAGPPPPAPTEAPPSEEPRTAGNGAAEDESGTTDPSPEDDMPSPGPSDKQPDERSEDPAPATSDDDVAPRADAPEPAASAPDEGAAGAAGATAEPTGPSAAEAGPAADVETVGSGSMPAALIGLIAAAVLAAVGGGLALLRRHRIDRQRPSAPAAGHSHGANP